MLKIDLLPKHFAVARKNKQFLALFIVLIIAAAGFLFAHATNLKAQTDKAKADTAALQATVQLVDKYTADTSAKQAEMKPLQDRVDFVKKADATGPAFWKAFHAVNDYIWDGAQMTSFSITPPNVVSFTVNVRGTRGAGKFLMNILRCPAITGITMNGLPAGVSVPGSAAPAGVPTMAAPGGMPYAGGPEQGPMATPTPMAPPPVVGAPTGNPGSPNELIVLTVTATLTGEYAITLPTPGGAAPAAGAPAAPPGAGAPGPTPGTEAAPPAAGGAPAGGAGAGGGGLKAHAGAAGGGGEE